MTRSDFDLKALVHAIEEIEDQISAADAVKLRDIKRRLDKLQDQITAGITSFFNEHAG